MGWAEEEDGEYESVAIEVGMRSVDPAGHRGCRQENRVVTVLPEPVFT